MDHEIAVSLCFASMLVWGVWPNLRKLCAAACWKVFLAAFFAGASLGLAGLALCGGLDAALIFASPRAALCACAGFVASLGLILLLRALEDVGMAVAAPVALGIEMALGTPALYAVEHNYSRAGALWLATGVAAALCAVWCNAAAKSRLDPVSKRALDVALAKLAPDDEHAPLVGGGGDEDRAVFRGVRSAVAAGLLFSVWPLFYEAVAVDESTNVREFVFAFAAGVLAATAMCCDDLENPSCDAVVCGLVAGGCWAAGIFLSLEAGRDLGTAVSLAIARCAPLVTAAFGIFVWNEVPATAPRIARILLFATLVLYVLAVAAFYQVAAVGRGRLRLRL